jgi:hypothetical protein
LDSKFEMKVCEHRLFFVANTYVTELYAFT